MHTSNCNKKPLEVLQIKAILLTLWEINSL